MADRVLAVGEAKTLENRFQCTRQFVMNAVKTAKFHFAQPATNRFIVANASKAKEVRNQEDKIETDLALVTEGTEEIGRCLAQSAVNVVSLAKSHFAQPATNQFIALLVLKKIREVEVMSTKELLIKVAIN